MDIAKYNSYRKCKECGVEKPLRAFPSKVCKANGKRYFQYRCNKCQYVLWKEKNADKVDKYYKAQRHREFYTIEGRASMLRNRCKCRARKYNHEFSLSKEKIITMLELGFCQQTGIELILNEERLNPYAPSIDRIDNDVGYIDSNIQVVCIIYNFCKNQFSDKITHDFIMRAKNGFQI